jgi:hypothetical protein
MSTPTPKQIHREGVMRAAGRRPSCALSRESITNTNGVSIEVLDELSHRLGPCSGRLQADHPIDKQRIRNAQMDARAMNGDPPPEDTTPPHALALIRTELDDLIADHRNGWLLCERHHEVVRTRKLVRVPRLLLPSSVQQFADDYGLDWSLDRDFD